MAQQQHARGEAPENRRAMMEAQDAEIRAKLKGFKHKLLVMSGKGGVGKSTIAAYLSVALARKGFRVGLMDVDLHGPSIPRLLGLQGNILSSPEGNKAIPLQYLPNMEVMSIESLLGDKDAATIWRGPLKIGVIKQFIADIAWTNSDYLIIDSPPGTGDEPLTIAQVIPDTKAIIVTTPQEISLADVRKSINFCRQVHMEILGLIENGSGLICPHCGKTIDLYKTNGGMLTAKKAGLTLLGSLPLEPDIVQEGDNGTVEWMDKKDMPYTIGFTKIVDAVAKLTK
jgi:ATP-binding protein involved in chromosome partitioning